MGQPFTRTRSDGGFIAVPSIGSMAYDESCSSLSRFLGYNDPWMMQNGTLKTTTDVVTPGFKRLSAMGKLIVNPYKSEREFQSGSGMYSKVQRTSLISCPATGAKNAWEINDGVAYYHMSGGQRRLSSVSLISDADIASAVKIAATQAWAQSNGHSANILQDIAEMRQTLSMLTRPLSSIKPLLKAMTSSRQKGVPGRILEGASSSFSSARNLWLQYRYGIRPLVSSVNGILQALKKTGGRHRQTYRGNYSLSKVGSSTGTTGGIFDVSFSWLDQTTDLVEIRTGLVIEDSTSLATSLGIDASGLLSLPWELVPFSFVADWFINVGSFLSALSPALTKVPLASWHTIKRKRTRSWNVTSTSPYPNAAAWTVVRPVFETRFATWDSTQRIVGIPGPSITFKPQSLGKVFADLRAIDAFALAAQQMGRLLRY